MKMYTMYWDFDSPLYAACQSCEDKFIIVKHLDSGRTKEFKNITKFWGSKRDRIGGWLAEQKGSWVKEDFEIVQKSRRNCVPLTKAKEFIDNKISFIKEQPFCKKLNIIVQGEGNFRKDIFEQYKKNRKQDKPIVFNQLKNWLIEKYNPIIVDGIESDDTLSSILYKAQSTMGKNSDVCGVYIDHDLLQCVGYKLNPNDLQTGIVWNDIDNANRCLFESLLSGDPGDNIPGLEGTTPYIWDKYRLMGKKYSIGKGNAKTILSDCKTKDSMIQRVQELYKIYYCDLWVEKLQLNYRLLKLLEDKNKICMDFPFQL